MTSSHYRHGVLVNNCHEDQMALDTVQTRDPAAFRFLGPPGLPAAPVSVSLAAYGWPDTRAAVEGTRSMVAGNNASGGTERHLLFGHSGDCHDPYTNMQLREFVSSSKFFFQDPRQHISDRDSGRIRMVQKARGAMVTAENQTDKYLGEPARLLELAKAKEGAVRAAFDLRVKRDTERDMYLSTTKEDLQRDSTSASGESSQLPAGFTESSQAAAGSARFGRHRGEFSFAQDQSYVGLGLRGRKRLF